MALFVWKKSQITLAIFILKKSWKKIYCNACTFASFFSFIWTVTRSYLIIFLFQLKEIRYSKPTICSDTYRSFLFIYFAVLFLITLFALTRLIDNYSASPRICLANRKQETNGKEGEKNAQPKKISTTNQSKHKTSKQLMYMFGFFVKWKTKQRRCLYSSYTAFIRYFPFLYFAYFSFFSFAFSFFMLRSYSYINLTSSFNVIISLLCAWKIKNGILSWKHAESRFSFLLTLPSFNKQVLFTIADFIFFHAAKISLLKTILFCILFYWQL